MCIICIDLIKERLTAAEAFRNYDEIEPSITKEHAQEVLELIIDKAFEEASDD